MRTSPPARKCGFREASTRGSVEPTRPVPQAAMEGSHHGAAGRGRAPHICAGQSRALGHAGAAPSSHSGYDVNSLRTDVAIIGGGLGACAAALAAARLGRRVVLTEETRWLGGQLTNQAVPPDEHPWIEEFGANRSYRALRDGIRAY